MSRCTEGGLGHSDVCQSMAQDGSASAPRACTWTHCPCRRARPGARPWLRGGGRGQPESSPVDPVDVRGRWQACGVPVMCLRPQGPALALALAFSPPEKGAPRKRGTVLSSSGSSLSGSLKSHGPGPGQRAGRCHTLHGGLPKLPGPLGLALGTAGWPSLTYRLHRFSSSCTRRHLPGCHDGCNYFCLQILSAQGKAHQAWPGKLRIVSHGGRDAAACPPRRPPAPACSRSCASVGTPRRDDGCHRLESASLHGRKRPPRKPFSPGVGGDLSGCVRRPDLISPFAKAGLSSRRHQLCERERREFGNRSERAGQEHIRGPAFASPGSPSASAALGLVLP